ncbi:glycosyltransferase [Aquabacterium fontiphilum]|uniref:glycosyltransferase family 2 protein n=1 Tax=Aquabacterium fontiphilum TaxID=450365 RepID=UPI0013783983|nr:glycosyltransferase family 2 protein [Aquabacterium fontiphilum]NBD22213.1 glycosyltransferase [Aquabacterium fontiphilum]
MRTLAILVNWRRASDTIACIECLVKNTGGELDIAVCDNASPDGSFEEIYSHLAENYTAVKVDQARDVFHFSRREVLIGLVRAPANLGFAGGNNLAYSTFKLASYTHYWFLNNDTEIAEGCLLAMLQKFTASERRVGMCGSTMVYFHDKRTVQALGGSTYRPWAGTMREIGNGTSWPASVNEEAIEAEMSYVCGASMLVSAELIRDVGLMREDYFLFFEEIDWCERARRAGYKLAYASNAIVYHKEGVAIGTGTGAKRSLLAEYYGMRNRLLVAWRLFPWTFPSVWLIGWLQVARRALQRRPANAWIMAKVLCGLGKRPV